MKMHAIKLLHCPLDLTTYTLLVFYLIELHCIQIRFFTLDGDNTKMIIKSNSNAVRKRIVTLCVKNSSAVA